jgi:serine/threonine protein phosphatase 1
MRGITRLSGSKSRLRKPRLPDGVRIYAMSDIHGCVDLLNHMFTVIDANLAVVKPSVRAIHVFLGDYVDRGPDSRRTLDLLIQRGRQHEVVFLKGNHEALMLEALEDPLKLQEWKQFGGLQTMMSYGLRPSLGSDQAEQIDLMRAFRNVVPENHRRFLNELDLVFSCGDFFFVHAGVRPGVPLDEQKEEDLLWIRDEFLQSDENFGKFVIHGHTPVERPDFRSYRGNIDTGAYATGNLTLLVMQEDKMLVL